MQAALQTTTNAAPVSATRRWSGRIVSALAALFLIFDGGIKVMQLAAAVDGSVQLGYPAHLVLGLGILELACLAIYLLPRTAFLGAVLLTGYLGGAVATHVRIGSPVFSVIFPILIGALLWGGLALRDSRLRALLLAQE
jgi:hypothetical protein